MHFTMSENALARKGERGSYFTRPNPKFTRQCERASGILHPWYVCHDMRRQHNVGVGGG